MHRWIAIISSAVLAMALLATTVSSLAHAQTEVVVALTDDPPSGDPHKARGANGGHLLNNLHEGLVRLSAEMDEISPALATSWERIDDQTWRFELRQGVTFHNGEPFNAEAVRYSLERLLDPNAVRLNSQYRHIEPIEIVDDYTIIVRTRNPDPIFLMRMADFQMVPPVYTATVSEEEFGRNPVGTGPYRFVEWRLGERLVIEAYDDYWGGRPSLDRLIFRPIPESSTRLAELQAQTIDIATAVSYDQIPLIERDPNIRVEANSGRRTVFLHMDRLAGAEPLQDARVRQAMSHAIDRELLIETVLVGVGTPLATIFRPDMFGYDPSLEPHAYDPDRARELLAEAGYPDGFTVRMLASETIITKGVEVSEAIASMLGDVGINVDLIITSLQAMRDMYIGNPDPGAGNVEPLWIWNWGSPIPDAASPLRGLLYTGATSSYSNDPEYDRLLDAFESEMDEAARIELARQLQAYLYTELPLIPLYLQLDVYGANERLDWQARKDEYVLGVDITVR